MRQIDGTLINKIWRKNIGEVESKIPDISGLVTAIALNTKIGETENKIPDHTKYIIFVIIYLYLSIFIFAGPIFDAKLKQANLAINSDVNILFQNVVTKIKRKRKTYKLLN